MDLPRKNGPRTLSSQSDSWIADEGVRVELASARSQGRIQAQYSIKMVYVLRRAELALFGLLMLLTGTLGAAGGEEIKAYEDFDLEALLGTVVTATKQEQAPELAPAIVEVVTYEDIRRRGYRNVAEALADIPGVSVIDDHTHYRVGVRGIFGSTPETNDIIKVMINGQPVSFRPSSANFLGNELIPIEAIKQIEVVRGPGSALYGANAFLGVVNILTFEGSDFASGDAGGARHMIALDGSLSGAGTRSVGDGGASLYSGGAFGAYSYWVRIL
jgi:outer membrane receptor protein involved in Fe transport